MLFNSYEFIFIFLPITLVVYFTLARFRYTKLATASLVFASLSFYSYWDIRYLPLLVSSILFNYTIGSFIEKRKNKNSLTAGIMINLLLLAYFKYTGFFIKSLNDVIGTAIFVPEIILPLGISFFTFTQTAYLVDAYRGETENYSLLTYSLFVTVFPHLIAGPILYHKDMIPQFSRLRNFVFSHRNMAIGITMFSIGLFKKVIIADTLAPWVKVVFDHADAVTFIEAWAGAIGYTLQLYFDFSGYSEMAIGLGLMFNFKLPINFNSPYQATSIIDFWRRWHITLSSFLKNYLYISLGGNRHGEIKRMRNLILTMLLGGLWHGAGWTFVIWGGLHGMYLVVNHLWRRLGFQIPQIISWLITFSCVVVAWVFFRAESVTSALSICKTMLGINGGIQFSALYGGQPELLHFLVDVKRKVILIAIFLVIALYESRLFYRLQNFRPNLGWFCFVVIILFWSIYSFDKVSEFLYFQF